MAWAAQLCEELEKEKATNAQLLVEVGELTEENGRLENLAESKRVIEKTKSWKKKWLDLLNFAKN